MKLRASFPLVLSVLVALAAVSCGGGDTPTPTPAPSATNAAPALSVAMNLNGTVQKGGAPATSGVVQAIGASGPCGTAQVNADGTFEMTIYQEREGTYPGCRTGILLRFEYNGTPAAETRELRLFGNRRPKPLDLVYP